MIYQQKIKKLLYAPLLCVLLLLMSCSINTNTNSVNTDIDTDTGVREYMESYCNETNCCLLWLDSEKGTNSLEKSYNYVCFVQHKETGKLYLYLLNDENIVEQILIKG